MFVLKNKNGEYFGHYISSTKKNKTGRWVESLDIDFYNIPTFATTEEADEYISKTLFFAHEPKPEIVKISEVKKYYEIKDPDIFRARQSLEENLLTVRGHKDSILALLNDPSLNHDINAAAGYVSRKLEAAGLEHNVKEAFSYSNTVSNLCYRDKDGNFRTNGENNSERLSFKARRAATFFATMADALLLLDKYEDLANKARKEANNA